jgi:endonuclease YncB( thermonuclease family)
MYSFVARWTRNRHIGVSGHIVQRVLGGTSGVVWSRRAFFVGHVSQARRRGMPPMKHIFKLIAMTLICAIVVSCRNVPSAVNAHYVRSIDGDTIIVDIDDWPDIVGRKMPIRLASIDTPEKHDKSPAVRKLSLKAAEYPRARLENAKTIELRNIRRGKYFRLLADVYVDGNNLSEELMKNGYAKPYNGGRKPQWIIERINEEEE